MPIAQDSAVTLAYTITSPTGKPLDAGTTAYLHGHQGLFPKVEAALTGARLVLWQVGAADALARIPPPEFRATLTEAVAWLRAHDIDLVLIGMRYAPEAVKDEHYQAIRQAVREVAIAESVPRVRRYEASEAIARMRAGAHAEPEAAADAAQDCMADWLAQAVAVGLFGRRGGGEARPAP